MALDPATYGIEAPAEQRWEDQHDADMGSMMGNVGTGAATGFAVGGPWGAVIGAGAGLLSGVLSGSSADKAAAARNEAARREAQENRNFQYYMSSTAYQRAVNDLKLADLNPMLAYGQGGASTPSGSMANVEQSQAPGLRVASAQAGTRLAAELENMTSQNELLKSQARNTDQGTAESRAREMQTLTNIPQIHAQTRRELWSAYATEVGIRNITQTHQNLVEEMERVRSQRRLNEFDLQYLRVLEEQRRRVENQLLSLEVPKAKNLAEAEGSWWKRNVSPYIGDAASSAGAASSLGLRHR